MNVQLWDNFGHCAEKLGVFCIAAAGWIVLQYTKLKNLSLNYSYTS